MAISRLPGNSFRIGKATFYRGHAVLDRISGCPICIPAAIVVLARPETPIPDTGGNLTLLKYVLADNCHLDRNVRELVEQQPFRSVELDEFYLEKTPKTHGYIYRGMATK